MTYDRKRARKDRRNQCACFDDFTVESKPQIHVPLAMNLREQFLKSVGEDSPEAFLRFIEQHVSFANWCDLSITSRKSIVRTSLFACF